MPDNPKISMKPLVLFDIDETLTTEMGHPDAFRHAFRMVYNTDTQQPPEGNPGMTDQQIISEILLEKGLDKQEILDKMSICMEEMADFYENSITDRDVELYDGVPEVLAELKKRGVLMGLVTGNVERIAWSKLKKAGIADYFRVGGFGSDDPERAELVRIAIKRAEDIGFRPADSNENVFVIGDTPKDIYAGKAAGTKTIGVASGKYPIGELKKAGADFVLDNLKDMQKILGIILG